MRIFFLGVFAVFGCSDPPRVESPQSASDSAFRADVEAICDGPLAVDPHEGVSARLILAARHILENLRSERGRALFDETAVMSPDDKIAALNAARAEVGHTGHCAWNQLVRENEAGNTARTELAQPEELVIRGALSAEQVNQVVRPHVAQVLQCAASMNAPITVRFLVTPDGTVHSSGVMQSVDAQVEECVSRVVSAWRFPPSNDQVTIVERVFSE